MKLGLTPVDAYSVAEQEALERYAVSSEDLNSALRAGVVSHPDLPLLDAAIARRRFTREHTLLVGGSRAGLREYVRRDEFVYSAFLSTTDTAGMERRYYSRGDPARLRIEVPAGTSAACLDDVPRAGQAEREYVLARNTRFHVLAKREVTNTVEVASITGDPLHPAGTTLLDVRLLVVLDNL